MAAKLRLALVISIICIASSPVLPQWKLRFPKGLPALNLIRVWASIIIAILPPVILIYWLSLQVIASILGFSRDNTTWNSSVSISDFLCFFLTPIGSHGLFRVDWRIRRFCYYPFLLCSRGNFSKSQIAGTKFLHCPALASCGIEIFWVGFPFHTWKIQVLDFIPNQSCWN